MAEATTTPLKAMSFFTGAGGLDLGMERAGIETILACDSEKWMRATIEANRPGIPVLGDLWNVSADEIREKAGVESIDVVAGGPPCQSFSTMGARRGMGDDRGNIFLHFIQLIGELNPSYAVIENVRGLLSMPLPPERARELGEEHGEDFTGNHGVIRLVTFLLRSLGYSVSFNLYNAANFGVPQARERVVIIASREGGPVQHLSPTHSDDARFKLKPWVTVAKAFSSIPEDVEHHFTSFPEKRVHYYDLIGPGENWRALPPAMQREALGSKLDNRRGGMSGYLRRIAWDKPSPTLLTHPAMPATDLGHPVERRPLSVEEYKVLQQFPLEWEVRGPLAYQYRQLGNAVPVGLGEAIGGVIQAHHGGTELPIPEGFKFSRYLGTSDGEIAPLDKVEPRGLF